MYIFIEQRPEVSAAYVSGFTREGWPSLGLRSEEFREWVETTSDQDLRSVQGFVLGDFDGRQNYPDLIRTHSRAPIIALSEVRSLEQTLKLFSAGIDDVVPKPVHVRELIARSDAVWRRLNMNSGPSVKGRLKVHFDGRDPEIDGDPLPLPRRERLILEYIVKNSGRRITKAQLFNSIYGIFNHSVSETVVEGHMSKLRKKLRQRLGYEVIEAKRYLGYCFVEPS
ncbi:DNA-binding response regulator, OmpR family, contains REC and winged-helix (wHTH) domain [Pseudoxanthobacter soli DSM 19599]|uniref:DNA-binding response regulator, OmpR family, contains REC and winged-helix (WHTH) domain n=1 Tax=Pseudoxanthobacter soli DSM 19599 TaxID=1123029 RepID=A0A1M7ZEM2_9HYPH|nr:response regulator transcription factor [Pseudoxanthobacter soli]SHO63318.1 DNA-binding response regulator, OmpR family, contains REC and winged-helix (wHTH) domain [Pseudoxanthobacter soli DSM 19599]